MFESQSDLEEFGIKQVGRIDYKQDSSLTVNRISELTIINRVGGLKVNTLERLADNKEEGLKVNTKGGLKATRKEGWR